MNQDPNLNGAVRRIHHSSFTIHYFLLLLPLFLGASTSRALAATLKAGVAQVDITPLEQDAVKWRDWTGEHLGEEAARVAQGIKTQAEPDPSIDYAEEELDFNLRWDPEKFRQGLLAAFGPKVFDDYGANITRQIKVPATTFLINKNIAVMGMPGEPFVDFQRNWRDRCPVRHALFFGYANGYYGYFPTIRAASMGGYGAASSSTWVEVGAGERMVDHAVATIYRMLGRLTDAPEDLNKR